MSNNSQLLYIRGESLFPTHFRMLGWIMLFLSPLVLLFASPVLSLILLLVGSGMIWSHSGVAFDMGKNRYKTYNSLWGMKSGNWVPCHKAVKLYVNSRKTSQYAYTRVNTGTTFRGLEYVAFLKLENEEKVFLTSRKKKEELMKSLQEVSGFFHLPITDNT